MFHESHPAVFGPALAVVIADDVFIVGIWVFSEISLDEFASLIGGELEDHVDAFDVPGVHANGVSDFSVDVLKSHEIVRSVGWSSNFGSSGQS